MVEACAMMLPPMGLVLSLAKLIPSGFATTWLVRTTATPNSSAIRVSCRKNLPSRSEVCRHTRFVNAAATAEHQGLTVITIHAIELSLFVQTRKIADKVGRAGNTKSGAAFLWALEASIFELLSASEHRWSDFWRNSL